MQIARLLLGLLAAVALPASVPALRTRPVPALAITGVLAAYAIVPVLNGWAAACTWLVALLGSVALVRVRPATTERARRPAPPRLRHVVRYLQVGTAVVLPLRARGASSRPASTSAGSNAP